MKEATQKGGFSARNFFFQCIDFLRWGSWMWMPLSFNDEALAWFQWEDRRRKMVSWDELKSRLLVRFGLTQEGSLCEKFLALKQEGSVREFCQNF